MWCQRTWWSHCSINNEIFHLRGKPYVMLGCCFMQVSLELLNYGHWSFQNTLHLTSLSENEQFAGQFSNCLLEVPWHSTKWYRLFISHVGVFNYDCKSTTSLRWLFSRLPHILVLRWCHSMVPGSYYKCCCNTLIQDYKHQLISSFWQCCFFFFGPIGKTIPYSEMACSEFYLFIKIRPLSTWPENW